MSQRGISRTEIVDGNMDAFITELCQDTDSKLRILHDHSFGNFKLEIVSGQSGFLKDSIHRLDKIACLQLITAQVYGNPDLVETFILPSLVIFTSTTQDPLANRDD